MKNIHILPTDKPSRLIKQNNGKLRLSDIVFRGQVASGVTQNIYITSDEEIKEGDWFIYRNYKLYKCTGLSQSKQILTDNEIAKHKDYGKPQGLSKKIILTTDQYLIKDGVQAVDDEFLEWFVKNPSCEEVEIFSNWHLFSNKDAVKNYGIIIPKEEETKCYCGHTTTCDCGPEQETLEQIDQNNPVTRGSTALAYKKETLSGFEEGHKANLDWLEQNSNQTKQETTLEEAAEKWYDSSEENKGFPKIEAFKDGAKWQQEQIIDFLHSEIIERRDYSSSKMCEKVIEFIEQFKNK